MSSLYKLLADKELERLRKDYHNKLPVSKIDISIGRIESISNHYKQSILNLIQVISLLSDTKEDIIEKQKLLKILNQIKLKFIFITPVHLDPLLDRDLAKTDQQFNDETIDTIISQLRPNHFIGSLETLIKIINNDGLASRKVIGKKVSDEDKKRGKEDEIFLSAGLPFMHLPSSTIDISTSPLIIFKPQVYYDSNGGLRPDFKANPRDSGGYKDNEERRLII